MGQQIQIEWAGRPLSISFGEVAGQADGAVLVRYADSVVLVTAVTSKKPELFLDFLPLTVEYQEMAYAAGRIPGGFFKREIGRPSDKEILTARLIDRSIRPLFPEGFLREIQIIATVLSVDQENDPDILAVIGASCALMVSDIPFNGPIAAVRVGRKGGNLIINPTQGELEDSDLNLIVAGHENGIVMVEGGGNFVPEEDILEAIFFGYEALKPVLALQKEELVGKPKIEIEQPSLDPGFLNTITDLATPLIQEALAIPKKQPRHKRLEEIFSEITSNLGLDGDKILQAQSVFRDLERKIIRQMALEGKRTDGRSPTDIRPVFCEAGVLPRTHGSAIFRRGETQILAVTTLGTTEDEQKIEALYGEKFKSFMVHYNFPPYCVGEVRRLKGPGRREIGHGALAERALKPLIPSEEAFPYTIRIVSEVLESNGSSSMATVCGGSLSLMDAGVPIEKHVAGIGMGLILEPERIIVLSDITGDEDHCGDMDFKIAGTEDGITAFQMDIKVEGLKKEVLHRALIQSREARLYILKKMAETLPRPRPSISPYAPKVTVVDISPEKIANLIGPGGRVIKNIINKTGVSIDIKETGKVHVISHDEEALGKAVDLVKQATQDVEIGKLYIGKVKKVIDSGALVEILPGIVGLVHISELDRHRVRRASDVTKEGDEVLVRVLGIEKDGRIRLSRKAALSPHIHRNRREMRR